MFSDYLMEDTIDMFYNNDEYYYEGIINNVANKIKDTAKKFQEKLVAIVSKLVPYSKEVKQLPKLISDLNAINNSLNNIDDGNRQYLNTSLLLYKECLTAMNQTFLLFGIATTITATVVSIAVPPVGVVVSTAWLVPRLLVSIVGWVVTKLCRYTFSIGEYKYIRKEVPKLKQQALQLKQNAIKAKDKRALSAAESVLTKVQELEANINARKVQK